MKALVYTGPNAVELRDVPDPKAVADDSALVRVESVGICGSDMHAFHGTDARRPPPLILGHEAAGTVVGGPLAGKRVTINPLVSCGGCPACVARKENLCPNRQIISMPPREGAFADYVTMPVGNLVEIPDGITTDQAALAEPIACGWHAVRLSGRVLLKPWADVQAVVLGGGAIGVGAALSLGAFGCTDVTVVEPHDGRRAYLSQRVGLTAAHAPPDTAPDLVIDAVGYTATRKTASEIVRPGGVIAHIGLGGGDAGLDTRRMTLQEITFIGTYTYTAEDFRETTAAIFDGRLGALNWPETRSLADGVAAFADLDAGRVAAPKIILRP